MGLSRLNGTNRNGVNMKRYVGSADNAMHEKWAKWSMQPKKQRYNIGYYASVLVVAVSAFIVVGFHQYLIF